MNSRLNFYGLPGAGISSDWIRPRIANRFQLKKKVIFGVILRRILACNTKNKSLQKTFQINPFLDVKHMYRKRTTCVEMGAPCLFRSGFYGAMRLNCCEGTSCENIGGNFLCVVDND